MESGQQAKKRTVLLDHDGSPDDIVSLMMLLNMKNVDLIGICVSPGRCIIEDSQDLTLKVLSLYEKSIPVAIGTVESAYPFPESYRVVTTKANHIPSMILQEMNQSLISERPAHEFAVEKISASKEKVTVLITGPATTFIRALEIAPEIRDNIEEVVWSAGAIGILGNVFKFDGDKTMEWNAHYDPDAAKALISSKLNVTLFPLDATSAVPVDLKFLKHLAENREYNITDMVGQFYALQFMNCNYGVEEVSLWDSITTAYLGCSSFVKFTELELDVLIKKPSLGRTVKAAGNGNKIRVADKIDRDEFIKFFREVLKVHGKEKQRE